MSKNLLDYVGLGYFLSKIKTLFVTGLGTSGNNLTWTKNGTTNNITIPYATQAGTLVALQSKTYTNIIGTANNNPGAVFYFLSVKPTDWNVPCLIRYRISATIGEQPSGVEYSIMTLVISRGAVNSYDFWNYIGNTSYRPYYYHYRYLANETGYNSGYGHLIGVGLQSSYNCTKVANSRTFVVEVLEVLNCTFTLLDNMTKYADVDGSGETNYSGELSYDATTQGNTHSGERDTFNRLTLLAGVGPVDSLGIKAASLIMENGESTWSQFTLGAQSTGTTKEKNPIGFKVNSNIYYIASGVAADANSAGNLYLTIPFDFRYSTNCGSTLVAPRPVYLVGTINSDDGLFYLDDTWWTQTLPNTNDGKVYIFLGYSYTTYQIQLYPSHPIYYFNDGKIRQYLVEQETDPVFSASPAAGITSANITSWNNKENTSNKVTSISNSSTDTLYPSAKLLYDLLTLKLDDDVVVACQATDYGNGVVYEVNKTFSLITLDIRSGKRIWFYIGDTATPEEYTVLYRLLPLVYADYSKVEFSNNSGTFKINSSNTVTFTEVTYESTTNKVTSISSSSTDTQYPSAKLVYDKLSTKLDTPTIVDALCYYGTIIGDQYEGLLYNFTTTVNSETVLFKIRTNKDVYLKLLVIDDSETEVTILLGTIFFKGFINAYDAYELSSQNVFYLLVTYNPSTNLPLIKVIKHNGTTLTVYKNDMEVVLNKVTSMSSSSTHSQYPSAKCVYDAINNINPRIPIINHGTSDTTFALTPNVYHKWESVSTLTLTLATPSDNTVLNEYMFSFISPSTPTTLSLPASVNWAIDLLIEPDKTYLITIIDNLATFVTVDMLNIIT